MKKGFLTILLLLVMATSLVWGATYDGKEIKSYSTSVVNVDRTKVLKIVKSYVGEQFSTDLYKELESSLLELDGVKSVKGSIAEYADGTVGLSLEITEYPVVGAFTFTGNSTIKTMTLSQSVKSIEKDSFVDTEDSSVVETLKSEVLAKLHDKGFGSATVECTVSYTDDGHTANFDFTIDEGVHTVVDEIVFNGNVNVSDSILKKKINSNAQGAFNKGNLNPDVLSADSNAILEYYLTIGYVYAQVDEPVIEEVSQLENKKYVRLVYNISEGDKWYFGGIQVNGNTIYSDADVAEVVSMDEGDVLNITRVQTDLSSIADLYYNNGYISSDITVKEQVDADNKTISYVLNIVEGPQATVQEVVIKGMTKTKEYVFRRELEMEAGDVFSKADLVTSYQNLYNTGLLSNLDYKMYLGDTANSIILEFDVEEGSQMDIQFGATIGGSGDGSFPVSGFLTWNDNNLFGRGQTLSVSTTISPDTKSFSIGFGDDWFNNIRWSNSINLGFNLKNYDDQLQLGAGLSEGYNGRNADDVYPLGYSSVADWQAAEGEYPDAQYLMDYKLLNISLGYSTGYTWIFNAGRLGVSSSLSIGLNRAFYEEDKRPYEALIAKYGEGFKFSNKISTTVQWDGRDYVSNTTKGYIVSLSATYAGGFLGGLTNFNKVSAYAAGYLKLFSFTLGDTERNVVASLSSTASFMFPQYYKNDLGDKDWHAAREGATQYEMLYMDGMSTARGHEVQSDQSVMIDNMFEIGVPIVEGILQGELFASATGLAFDLDDMDGNMNWFFSAGFGVRLKVSGFPLGIYLVKTATADSTNGFKRLPGNIFNVESDPLSGWKIQLAISMSLI